MGRIASPEQPRPAQCMASFSSAPLGGHQVEHRRIEVVPEGSGRAVRGHSRSLDHRWTK